MALTSHTRQNNKTTHPADNLWFIHMLPYIASIQNVFIW
jgi:hypothetical protein